jgi:DNA polymerase
MSKSYHDLETFSPTPIKNGTHIYAEKAEVMLWAYALEDGPVRVWDLTTGAPMPADLAAIIDDEDCLMIWHNGGMFDRTVLIHALPQVYSRIAPHRWYDTMVQAYAHSLPGSLDLLCTILGVPIDQAKHKDGQTFIQLFCKLRRDGGRNTRLTHPEQWARFVAYAGGDITSMRVIHKKMPTWNYAPGKREHKHWLLDQVINQRGLQMDTELARAAVRAIDRAQKGHAARTQELTDGEVQKATQRDKLLKHLLAEYDIDLPDLKKSTLERRINDPDLPDPLRELLAIRLEATMTSSSKYKTLLRGVSSDGRLRGLMQFCGANRTGRVAHRLFQPGNMPRPDVGLIMREMGVGKLADDTAERYTAMGIDALKADCADQIFGNVMGLTANVVRGSIVVPEGRKLNVSDLSNIEGRKAAWLTGEEWKLQAFRDYDAGTGLDLYILAYARSFGVSPADVTKAMRQLGKIQELALAYEGGVGAFVTFTLTYKMELDLIRAAVFATLDAVDPEIVREARNAWEWATKQKRTLGLEKDIYIACDILKRLWRRAHPATSSYWPELKDAAIQAICSPGTTVRARRVVMRRDGNWLRVQMPSGRQLCYIAPRVDDSGQISYMGVNQYTRKWQRVKTYGGKLFENLCQASARDILFENMPAIESAGYSIVLSIHDELLTETPDTDDFNAEHLSAMLATVPEWAEGLPLSAAGFDGYRYRKD